MDQHAQTARQFGSTAARYLTSPVHARGADLDRLVERVAALKPACVLDLGCGAGHASFAAARGGAGQIVAYDLAQPMLDVVIAEAAARGHTQIQTRAGAAERLPFTDVSFDLVVTRYSAHHWLDLRGALVEAARVLRPQGALIVIDVCGPESPLLDTVLQTVELLRDLSHVRDYRESEWRAALAAAGFSPPHTERWKLPMDFHSWVARIGTSAPRIAALEVVLDELPAEARSYFAVGADRSFAVDSLWLEAAKSQA